MRKQSNSFGISDKFIERVDLESSRFVAVFMEDGKRVEESKAFKYNLSEKFHNLKEELELAGGKRRGSPKRSKAGKATFTNQKDEHVEVLERAFKQLLEELSQILTKGEKEFCVMYTSEGDPISTF